MRYLWNITIFAILLATCLVSPARAADDIEVSTWIVDVNLTKPIQPPSNMDPAVKLLTRAEMAEALAYVRQQETLRGRAEREAADAALDAKIDAHCAEREAQVEKAAVAFQQLMLNHANETSPTGFYAMSDVALDTGFCTMSVLSQFEFIVMYDVEDRQLRAQLVPTAESGQHTGFLIVKVGEVYPYRSASGAIGRDAVRAYFSLWDKQQAACRWIPCDP